MFEAFSLNRSFFRAARRHRPRREGAPSQINLARLRGEDAAPHHRATMVSAIVTRMMDNPRRGIVRAAPPLARKKKIPLFTLASEPFPVRDTMELLGKKARD